MKIGIIGMGSVGTSTAVSLLQQGVAHELLLNDRDQRRAEGEAMDLRHGASFYPAADVSTASIEDMRECHAVVIAAGRGGSASESRLDLLKDTASIARDIGRQLRGARGLIVVVSNPVDILTNIVAEATELPHQRVFGTGTMLDTARLRQVLGRELALDPRSVHAHVVGEHGDSEVVLWSSASVGGVSLRRWSGWNRDREPALAAEVRSAAYEIIARKGMTNHAIGLVTAALLKWALRRERRILTVSRVHESGPYAGTAISLPTLVGPDGATRALTPDCDADEQAALDRSAATLREARSAIGF